MREQRDCVIGSGSAVIGHSGQVILLKANQIGQHNQVLVYGTESTGDVKLYFRLSGPKLLDRTGDRIASWRNDEQHETGQATKDKS